MPDSPIHCVVVFSGGQDSTTCLYWAIRRFGRDAVAALTIDYGQRHRIELDAAAHIAARAGVVHRILPCDSLRALGGNALTGDEAVEDGVRADTGLPNSFVPGRNLLFMTLAAAWAWQLGARHMVLGVAQTDYSGYPDCREPTLAAQLTALQLGMELPLELHTPLMHLTKADTVHLARDVGALEALAHSHTCYNGAVPPCGHCPACVLRAKGFAEAGVPDPLVERTAG